VQDAQGVWNVVSAKSIAAAPKESIPSEEKALVA
jgi:hypothetical protein